MNRRNGMWLTVLCILAAGVLTTSVTSSFVRESTEAAMAAVTETEARGAQISVPRGSLRTGSFPKGYDGPGGRRRTGKGGKSPPVSRKEGAGEPGSREAGRLWTPAWRRPGNCPGSTRAALRKEMPFRPMQRRSSSGLCGIRS